MQGSCLHCLYFQPGIKQENECRICKDEALEKHKETEHEELIVCSECKSKGHPTCLDLNGDMVRVIKTYPWQCMECKTCVQCMDPYDEVWFDVMFGETEFILVCVGSDKLIEILSNLFSTKH
jgi:hypothetical protein